MAKAVPFFLRVCLSRKAMEAESRPTFKNEVRKFCRKRLAVKQCFALAQSYEKHTAGLP